MVKQIYGVDISGATDVSGLSGADTLLQHAAPLGQRLGEAQEQVRQLAACFEFGLEQGPRGIRSPSRPRAS